jgi:hypothetical protein
MAEGAHRSWSVVIRRRPSGTSRKIYTGVSAPRGRPPYDFLHDPERYAIAYIDALVALGVSETDAFKAAAARMVGIPMGCRTVDPRRKRGRGLVQGGVLVNYENGSTTIVGKADTLRRKFKRPMSPEEGMWRVAMGHAFLLAMRGKDLHRCALTIEELAKSVGEVAYAQTVLLPLLAAKILSAPFYARRSDWNFVKQRERA